MKNKQLYFRLKFLIELKKWDSVEEILDILETIAEDLDLEDIPLLLDCLEDDPLCLDVRDSIMMLIEEGFPQETYISILLISLKLYIKKIPECLEVFFYHVFNSPKALLFLKQNIYLADKDMMLELLDYMEKDEPLEQHKPIIAELRRLINEKRPIQDDLF